METITVSHESLPLSLKHYSYLKVVVNTSRYPVSYLSLLPTALRRSLLVFLPAIEIHRLEGTSFVSDIDTSVYWDELYSRYKPHLPIPMNEHEFVKTPFSPLGAEMEMAACTGKNEILDSAVQSVFHVGAALHSHYCAACRNYLNVPFAVLLTVRNVVVRLNEDHTNSASSSVERLLEYYGLKVLCQSLQFVVTNENESSPVIMESPRVIEKNRDTKVAIDGIRMLMSVFQKYPKVVNTSLPSLWIFKEQSVVEFLSHMQALCLSGDKGLPEEILGYINSLTSNVCLKTLLINTELSGDQIHSIVPHFSSQRGKRKGRSGYDKLEEISAGKFLKQEKHPKQPNNPLGEIASIISYQKNLRHVRLYGYFGHSPSVESLMSSLCKLVTQPQLESLMVEGFNKNCQVSTEKFSKIILRFLSNQAPHHQHLTFTSFQVIDTKTTLVKMAKLSLDVSKVRVIKWKSLNIIGVCLPSQAVKLFAHIPPVCFDSLGISLNPNIDHCQVLPNLTNSHRLLLAADHGDEDNSVLENEIFPGQIVGFILNSNLRLLTIHSISLVTLEACEAFSQALYSQAADIQSLTEIHFRHCFSGIKKEYLKILFKSLISLAQEVDLNLVFEESLSEKFMDREHVNLLNETWKTFANSSSGVKRIKKLKCNLFNAGEDELLKMDEVVEELTPVFKHFEEFLTNDESPLVPMFPIFLTPHIVCNVPLT